MFGRMTLHQQIEMFDELRYLYVLYVHDNRTDDKLRVYDSINEELYDAETLEEAREIVNRYGELVRGN